MEVIQHTIKYSRPDVFNIYPLGDIHMGSISCKEEAIEKKIAEICQEKNSYVIGMGDYAECITKNDKRFDVAGLADWVKKDNIIESQRERVVKLFKPLVEKKKLLGMLTGNHEESIHAFHQDDFTRNVCKDLGATYGGYACFFTITFERTPSLEKHQYVIHAWHGSGGSQTEGARLMRLVRLVNDIQAHIYLMGHLHAITQHTPDRLVCSARGRVSNVRLVATITGSWVTTYTQPKGDQHINPSYGERAGFKPSRIGCPVVHIWPDRDQFTVES